MAHLETPGGGVFLSVVIPAYNEEKRLPQTLRAVMHYLKSQSYSWEVVVVNDGSQDQTVRVVEEAIIVEPRVRLAQYGQNRGKGYAVRFGMLQAQGSFRLFMDADNSTTIDQVARFWPIFDEGFDIVIGSRDVPGADIPVHQPRWKEFLGDLGNWWIRAWAVPGIRDTQAGFKVFKGSVAQDIFSQLTLDRWGFDIEVLAVARVLGYRVAERPIRWVNSLDSKVSPTAYFQVLGEVIKVWRNVRRGIYSHQPAT